MFVLLIIPVLLQVKTVLHLPMTLNQKSERVESERVKEKSPSFTHPLTLSLGSKIASPVNNFRHGYIVNRSLR